MFKMLPQAHPFYCGDMKLVFDPIKSPHYKVIHLCVYENENENDDDDDDPGIFAQIQIYSSKTCNWSFCDDCFPYEWFEGFINGVYWSGAIHWLNVEERSFHYKLEILDIPLLTIIESPLLAIEGKVHFQRRLLKSYESLLLLCKDYYNSRDLNIYEMKNGNSEWSVKYFVNLDDMMRPFPSWRVLAKWDCYQILSIVLGEQEEDSFMVIELSGKILQYKLVLETVSELFDSGKEVSRCDLGIGVRQSNVFEFMESFAHV